MPDKYTYAVARIHTKENSMLSLQELERLLATDGIPEAFAFLSEKGYDTLNAESCDEIIRRERAKMWKLVSELVPDLSVFDIFLYETDFHNLKAAVKALVTQDSAENIFIDGGTVDSALISEAIKKREYDMLPTFLRETAEKAVKALLETHDGGLCDIICDRAYLENCLKASEKSDNLMIKNYGELTVALADIRIAARGARLGKNGEFFKRALAECRTLNKELLAAAAAKGFEEFADYLGGTDYRDAVEILRTSYTAFEKWCDDRFMAEIKKEKHNYFTVAPIAAYVLAKESELKMVGLVLTAKQNKLEEAVIRERLRELYV
ncbi:MAG: V-type ATPase subunit [Clostridia bacterium]|nr:V-type ATPase subunit [Clostridia bacterium]